MNESKRTYYKNRPDKKKEGRIPGSDFNKMIVAIREGDITTVRFLLCANPMREGKYCGRCDILVEAIKYDRKDIILLLVKEGAKINNTSRKNKKIALNLAKKNANHSIIRMLINNRAPMTNADTRDNLSPSSMICYNYMVGRYRDEACLEYAVRRAELARIAFFSSLSAACRSVADIQTTIEYSTMFHAAILNGDANTVNFVLSKGTDINTRNAEGETPLYIAIKERQREIIKILLRRGASVHSVSPSWKGYSPLQLACENGSNEIVELLLRKGANVNYVTHNKVTSIYLAVKSHNYKLTELLLKYKANVNTRDIYGDTILHLAVECGDSQIVDIILSHAPDVNNDSNKKSLRTAVCHSKSSNHIVKSLLQYGLTINPEDVNDHKFFRAAIENGYVVIVEKFLKRGIKLINEPRLLAIAVRKRLREMIELLLKHGWKVNTVDRHGYSALHWTALSKQPTLHEGDNDVNISSVVNITKLLLKKKAAIDARTKTGLTTLHLAIQNDYKGITGILLKNGANVNLKIESGATPLHFAVQKGMTKTCRLLVKREADVNIQDTQGLTALHLAIQEKNEEIVQILLEHGANVSLRTESGATPLHFVAQKGMENVCRLLVGRGVDVNSQDTQGLTALHLAIQERNEEVAQILLEHGADVSLKTESGATPLHFAAQKGMEKVFRFLIRRGVDVNAKDKSGLTVLHLAAQNGHVGIVEILLDSSIDVNSVDENGNTAIHLASETMQHRAFIALMDSSDINIINKQRRTVFHFLANSHFQFFYRNRDHDPRCRRTFVRHFKNIQRHLLKMEVAGFDVNKDALRILIMFTMIIDRPELEREYKKEVEEMKNTKISNTEVTFHDILIKDINLIVSVVRDPYVVRSLTVKRYRKKFPLYADMIKRRLDKAIVRKELLDKSHTFFYGRFITPYLPLNCIEHLLRYLSNADIMMLRDIFKNSDSNIDDVTEQETE